MTRNMPCTTCKRRPRALGTESLRVSMTRSVAPTTDKRGWRYDRLDTENFGSALLMTYFFDKAKGNRGYDHRVSLRTRPPRRSRIAYAAANLSA